MGPTKGFAFILAAALLIVVVHAQSTQPTRVMDIRVIDATSREALAGARVETRVDETDAQVTTGRDGTARVTLPDGEIAFLRVRAIALGHVPAEKFLAR
jgi:hypothetical protein